MKLELKNLKVHRDMSEETVCFSATIPAALDYLNRVYGDQLEKILTEDNVQECVRL